jgi:hypothetical protein
MPVSSLVIAFFIVLGSGAVSLGGTLVVLGSLLVQPVHNSSLQRKECGAGKNEDSVARKLTLKHVA